MNKDLKVWLAVWLNKHACVLGSSTQNFQYSAVDPHGIVMVAFDLDRMAIDLVQLIERMAPEQGFPRDFNP
jgi:hypothetical protein